MKNWEILKQDMIAERIAIQTKEPEDVYRMRTYTVEQPEGCEAGAYGLQWSFWDFANGMIRDFIAHTVAIIYKLGKTDEFDMPQLRAMVRQFHAYAYTDFMGYIGFRKLKEFDNRLIDCLDEIETKEEFLEVYAAYLMYGNKVNAWVHHYFNWELGYQWKPAPLEK